MKRFVCFLLILCMMLSAAVFAEEQAVPEAAATEPAAEEAEIKAFDYTQMENLKQFSYDQETNTWTYGVVCQNATKKEMILLCFGVRGPVASGEAETSGEQEVSEEPLQMSFFTTIMDKNFRVKYIPTSVDFVIGKKHYTYKTLDTETNAEYGAAFITDSSYALIEAIAKADKMTAKIGTAEGKTFTVKLDSKKLKSTLKAFCQNIIKYDVWAYVQSDADFDEKYPITIS